MGDKIIEVSGKTAEEAIQKGLEQLGASREEVEIEVVREGSKGLFGIGGKDYIIRLTKRMGAKEVAVSFVQGLCKNMKVEAEVTATEEEQYIRIELSGKSMGILIGHRGETLDAIQYLTNLVVNSHTDGKRVIIDTENYRKKREESLERLARKLASKVKATGRPVSLEPMTPYERRILHATLQNNTYVTTQSEGEEPNRRVVILPR